MLSILFEAAIRITLVTAGIALVLRVVRVRQAAIRHAVWTAVVPVMLTLPAWIAWGPTTTLPVLPVERWQAGPLNRTAALTATTPTVAPAQDRKIGTASIPQSARDWRMYLLILYSAGASMLLVRIVIGSIRVRRLTRGAWLQNGMPTHAACVAPVTVGWWRPVVILPEGWTRWPERQRDAILAHEQEHVRRRDPLIQCLALMNRAIFWFHPVAWWLERELAQLAEDACDAAVLARGHKPREYAEYLLSLARTIADTGTRYRVLGMAATGVGLPQRIRNIMSGDQLPSRLSRPKLTSVAIACAIVAGLCTTGWLAHAQPASPSFDAASIKTNRSGEQGGSSKFAANTYLGVNVTLKRVIGLAYSPIQAFTGGPGWIESDRYDITAKAEGNPGRQQLQFMLRSLLADRFKLVVHKETRDSPAFALVLDRSDGKLGPSLRRSDAQCAEPVPQKGPSGNGDAPACGFRIGAGALAGRGATMERLAAELILLDRLVVDRTGLTGVFDMDVQWTPGEHDDNSDLFRALREQLGLKLQPTRVPVEVLVIESAAKPTEN
jgi:bla regulator protein blaR1